MKFLILNLSTIYNRKNLCFFKQGFFNKLQNGELKSEDYEFAKEEMLKFNNNFNEPLRGHIIESATRVVNYRQYLYKNETILDFLELDYELCERLGLESIYKIKTRKERNSNYYKKKLKEDGKLSKNEELKQLRAKIKNLRAKGLSNKEIIEHLDIPIKSLERHITYMRKNGLLQ